MRSSTSLGSIPLLAKTSSRGFAAPKGLDLLLEDEAAAVEVAVADRGLSCIERKIV